MESKQLKNKLWRIEGERWGDFTDTVVAMLYEMPPARRREHPLFNEICYVVKNYVNKIEFLPKRQGGNHGGEKDFLSKM